MFIKKVFISVFKKIVLLSSILVFSTSCYSSRKNPPGSSLYVKYSNFNDYYTNFYEPLKKRNPHRYMCFVEDEMKIVYSVSALFVNKEEFEKNKGDIIYDLSFVRVDAGIFTPDFTIGIEFINLAEKQVDLNSDIFYNFTSSGDSIFFLGEIAVCSCKFTPENNHSISNEEKSELCDQFITCFLRGIDYVM